MSGLTGVMAGCSGAQVHVRNRSAMALQDVAIATTGATTRIDVEVSPTLGVTTRIGLR